MSEFLRVLFSLSISGSSVLLVLRAFRPLYRKRLSKTWQYYILLVAAARFMLPVALPVNLVGGLMNSPAVTSGLMEKTIAEEAAPIPMDTVFVQRMASESAQPAPVEQAGTNRPPLEYAALLWAGIALVMLARGETGYRGFIRFVRAGMRPAKDAAIEDCILACQTVGLKTPPPVYVNPAVSTPMLLGVFRPFVLLPDDFMEDSYSVFLHELTHRKRMDNLCQWAVQIAVCVHWFNPLVYLLRRELARYAELSCDEAVLHRLDRERHRRYGDMLLAASVKNVFHFGNEILSMPLSGEAKLLKERLGAIMEYKKTGKRQACGSVVLGILAAAGALICGCATLTTASQMGSGLPVKPLEQTQSGFGLAELQPAGKSAYSRSFYENGFIFQLGWDVKLSAYPVTRKLETNPACTVAFTDKTKQYADRREFLDGVTRAVEAVHSKWTSRPASPLVMSADGPFAESPNQLAVRFYKEKNISYFSAVTSKADESTKNDLASRAYQDRNIPYLSILSDEIDAALQKKLATQAFTDGRVAEFSILYDVFSREEKARMAKQAYEDGKIAFFSILSDDFRDAEPEMLNSASEKETGVTNSGISSDSISGGTAAEIAKKAYEDNKVDFFYAVMDSLSQQELAALAKQAYADDKVEFFYVLDDALSQQELAALAKQAYADDKVDFFYVLADALSAQEKAALAKKAYDDDKIEFYYALQ